MQIPILNGIYTDQNADVLASYPVNLVPVPASSGVSNGYLRPADGIVSYGSAEGVDRGGINWNNVCYRASGTKLIRIADDGTYTVIGDIGSGGQCTFDYSFDRLAISSGGRLYYYDGATLTQVTDVDLGTVLDVLWVDGYFMTTDGEYLVVTELADPTAVDPLKYGSSEVDPDEVKGLLKLRNEVYALNRYTIEAFDNVGGTAFPFQRIDGAQIQKGVLGTYCACVIAETIAFLGSGRNEAPGVYLVSSGSSIKISTRTIDCVIAEFTEDQLALSVLEAKTDKDHNHLWISLPDRVLVYDINASQAMSAPVWFTLTSGLSGFEEYPVRNMVWCYDKWIVGDPSGPNYGYLTTSISTQYGIESRWQFDTQIVYNESRGAIFSRLELIGITGRSAVNDSPIISTSYSTDGTVWSQEKAIAAGRNGDRNKRLVWWRLGTMRNFRLQRFSGTSSCHASFMRLEADLEPLAV